ncbi:helix-turn-helix domain-containing protein [Paraglaciecola chathamensis]|uniref:MerR family transcriptional regulator n=1 Tax=Paraglaciecola chathamensis TaxID=368405 RepID=A0A8H9IHD6_9ALTE|nr:helix-turn-helix domain-containing protein [Paraglaciecola oceanifecundans]GGZ67442.1 MerR family transcriptional regulator [Paraglaciecola oceanifecundans]
MDISTVAKRSGVPASTLRYYEDKGLIQSVGRKGLQRLFAANILERLALIALGRVAGFSLDEISNILGVGENPDIDREMLLTKATELDRTIQKLTAMRDGLQHAAACTAPSHLECPRFRRLMGLAASGAIKGQPSNIAKPISR